MVSRRKSIDEVIAENHDLKVDGKIQTSEVTQRCISDDKYAPIEVKAWVIYLVVLFIGAAVLIWQRIAGLK